MTRTERQHHPASFRDPHGYVFEVDGVLHRAVETLGEPDHRAFIESGLYDELRRDRLLVGHDDLGVAEPAGRSVRVLRPERVPVVSYASEWTFTQLRAAALLTLDIQERALRRGMSLRDASSFNVQFVGVRAVFIDTLSFAKVGPEPQAWIAYRQFCEQFLAPLALIAHHGHAVAALWTSGLEGVPLPMASRLLPAASWLQAGVALHIHLHAKVFGQDPRPSPKKRPHRAARDFGSRLVESLRAAVTGIALRRPDPAIWADYRTQSTYSAEDTAAKLDFVRSCVVEVAPARAIDLGANDGLYAGLLAESGVPVTAVDADAATCESVVNGLARRYPDRINTACVDLANPTPSFGWAGQERSDFTSRYRCDLVLVLALMHHLSIGKQIPFASLAEWLARLGPHLIVEYVPPHDPMAARLLAARPGGHAPEVFSEQAFLNAFTARFDVLRRSAASSAGRTLFWMRRRDRTR